MNSTAETLSSRIHERLAQSRFFTISLAIHVAILLAVGSIVIVRSTSPPPDFEPVGGYPMSEEPPLSTEPPPPETAIPKEPATSFSMSPPVAPSFSAPPIPVVSTSMSAPVSMPIIRFEAPNLAPNVGTVSTPPTSVATSSMGRRFSPVKVGGMSKDPTATKQTEQAVLRALAWLRKVQNADGSWGERNHGAMTGLALLCFLGHGEYGQSVEYGLVVNRAVEWIVERGTQSAGRLSMTADGWGSGNAGVYEHGIATYALGEYYTMTRLTGKPDERVVELLRSAVRHIVEGQGPDGGWMYRFDKTQSDTSVSGWQVQALKAAHLSELKLDGLDVALDRAMLNFQRVQTDKGAYGYRKAEDRWSLTGVGVLCELFWRGARDSGSRKGVEFIMRGLDENPLKYQHERADLYAWYYHTQALLMFGNASWRKWDDLFSPELVKSQSPDGSWPVMTNAAHGNLQKESSTTGGIYRTSLCVLMLESYYRYLPANR